VDISVRSRTLFPGKSPVRFAEPVKPADREDKNFILNKNIRKTCQKSWPLLQSQSDSSMISTISVDKPVYCPAKEAVLTGRGLD
jgi:hypothetical protein